MTMHQWGAALLGYALVAGAVAPAPAADVLGAHAVPGARWHHEAMPAETHATIYHPAALRAFRYLFEPERAPE